MEQDNEMERLKMKEYLKSFPVGYRFCPTDEELVTYYLMNKVSNERLPPNNISPVNLYQYSPQDLSDKYREEGERIMYFFTPRDRKYPKGNRPNRAAGNGFWKATGVDIVIGAKENPVGYRKALVYYQGRPKDPTKTNWIMHEYRIDQKSPPCSRRTACDKHLQIVSSENKVPPDMKLDDWVLCKVYQKVKKSDKNSKRSGSDNISSSIIYVPPSETNYNALDIVGSASSLSPLQTNYNVPATVGSTSSLQRYYNVPHVVGSASSVPPPQRYCNMPHVVGSTISVPPLLRYCNVPNNIDPITSSMPPISTNNYTNNMTEHQSYCFDLPSMFPVEDENSFFEQMTVYPDLPLDDIRDP